MKVCLKVRKVLKLKKKFARSAVGSNLGFNVIRRSVDLELSVEIPLGRLVADDVVVDGVVEQQRALPPHQDGSVLLAGEIRDGRRRGSCDVGSLDERRGSVAVVSRCDGHDDDFVLRVRSYKRKIIISSVPLPINEHSQLTQLLQRVIMNSGFTSHPVLGIVLRHRQMCLVERCVIDAVHEVRSVRLLRLQPRDLDGR